jgi:post-segregation antitoxin (ccd killing protein)
MILSPNHSGIECSVKQGYITHELVGLVKKYDINMTLCCVRAIRADVERCEHGLKQKKWGTPILPSERPDRFAIHITVSKHLLDRAAPYDIDYSVCFTRAIAKEIRGYRKGIKQKVRKGDRTFL